MTLPSQETYYSKKQSSRGFKFYSKDLRSHSEDQISLFPPPGTLLGIRVSADVTGYKDLEMSSAWMRGPSV